MRPSTRMVVLGNRQKYVLDLISVPAAVAYGLRRLNASWTGAAIRVRRNSDNAEIDIGFIGENLDVITLLAFVGVGNGFITTWYDQSGNYYNATQTTPNNQPRIVNAGVIDTQSNRPAVVFDGVNDRLSTASTTLGITNSASLSVVTRLLSSTAQGIVGSDEMDSRFGFFITGSAQMRWNSISSVGIEASSVTGTQILVGTVRTAGIALFRNGTSIVTGTGNTSSMRSTPFNIGNMLPGTTLPHFSGWITEVVAFPSALSTTDRQTLERNQGIYFDISLS